MNFALRRTILRYNKPGFEPNIFFRRRSITPNFRIRKNALIMQEKISRLGSEFDLLRKLCELRIKKIKLESKYVKTASEMIKEYISLGNNKNLKNIYRKKILKKVRIKKLNHNLFLMMKDRAKISQLQIKKNLVEPEFLLRLGPELNKMINKHESNVYMRANSERKSCLGCLKIETSDTVDSYLLERKK